VPIWAETLKGRDLTNNALTLDLLLESQGVLFLVYKKDEEFKRFRGYIDTLGK